MNWTAIEDAVRAWVAAKSGLPATSVYFANQDYPHSEIAPRIVISVSASAQAGLDELTHDYDSGRPPGEQIEYSLTGMREVTFNFECFSAITNGAGSAVDILQKVQTACRLPSVRDTLNAAGLGLMREGNVQRVPNLRAGMREDQATLSVIFNAASKATERTTYIETVVSTTNVSAE